MPPAKLAGLNNVFATVVNSALVVVGILSVIMIVIGGINYLGSGGDKEGTGRAKATLTFAIVGLVLALSAWMILNIFGGFLGINVSNFNMCFDNKCP